MHTYTLLGHRRQMLQSSDDGPSAASCAYFPLVTLEVAFFICYASSSPSTVCYINAHSARDKGCNMSPTPLTNMPKGTLVKIQASLQTTILSHFFYPVGFIPRARRAFRKKLSETKRNRIRRTISVKGMIRELSSCGFKAHGLAGWAFFERSCGVYRETRM